MDERRVRFGRWSLTRRQFTAVYWALLVALVLGMSYAGLPALLIVGLCALAGVGYAVYRVN